MRVHRPCFAGSLELLSFMNPAGWLWAHLVCGQNSLHPEEKKENIFFRQYFSVLTCCGFPSGPLECMRWELMALPRSEFCCYCAGGCVSLAGIVGFGQALLVPKISWCLGFFSRKLVSGLFLPSRKFIFSTIKWNCLWERDCWERWWCFSK